MSYFLEQEKELLDLDSKEFIKFLNQDSLLHKKLNVKKADINKPEGNFFNRPKLSQGKIGLFEKKLAIKTHRVGNFETMTNYDYLLSPAVSVSNKPFEESATSDNRDTNPSSPSNFKIAKRSSNIKIIQDMFTINRTADS